MTESLTSAERAYAETLSQITALESLQVTSNDTDPELPSLLSSLRDLLSLQSAAVHAARNSAYPIGSKCTIPFSHPSDPEIHYLLPAVILSHDESSADTSVLILSPLTSSTIPCDSNVCSGLSCQLSHGYSVPSDLILPYEALGIDEVERFAIGRKVWCRYEKDEIWYKARIRGTANGGGGFRVQFEGYEEDGEVLISWGDVIPIKTIDGDEKTDDDRQEESDSWSSDSYSSDSEESIDNDKSDRTYEEEEDNATERPGLGISSHPIYLQNASEDGDFGAWERYTHGTASRIMQLMGYKIGQGLGKDGAGRVNPIEVEILKKGRGLDYNAEEDQMLERRKRRKGARRKGQTIGAQGDGNTSRKRKRKGDDSETMDQNELSIFEFINNKLSHAIRPNISNDSTTSISSRPAKSALQPAPDTKKSANVTLMKLNEEIAETSKNLTRTRESLARNRGSALEETYDKKVGSLVQKLEILKRRAGEIQRGMNRQKERERMGMF